MTNIIHQKIDKFCKILDLHINDGVLAHDTKYQPILIQYWEAKCSEGYHELTNRDQVFHILCSEEEDESSTDPSIIESKQIISSYRSMVVVEQSYRVYEDEEEGNELLGVPGRVFRSKRAEDSLNISHYSEHEYPRRDITLQHGITSCLCLPVFATNEFSDNPNGVLEFLFTSHRDFHNLKLDIYEYYTGVSTILTFREKIYVCRHDPLHIYMPPGGSMEINPLLTAVCSAYSLPLAQCWIIPNNSGRPSFVTGQSSSLDLQYSKHWCKFKEACALFRSYLGDGLVSKTFESHKSYFCRDITGLKITDYPLVHYVRDCGSIACFTIYLDRVAQLCPDYVLEFFLPYKEMDIINPHIFLNSLLATLKDHLRVHLIGFVKDEVFFEVIDSSMLSETKYLKNGHPVISLPHHNGSQKEKDAVPQLPLNSQIIVDDGEQQDRNVVNVHESSQKERDAFPQLTLNCQFMVEDGQQRDQNVLNVHEASQKERDAVPQLPLLCHFKVEDGQQHDQNVLDVEENYSALGKISRTHDSVTEVIYVDDLEEESLVKDITESQPLSTMKLLPQVQGTEMEEERLMQLRLQESKQNQGIIVDAEKYGSSIHFINTTCIERTAEGEKRSENGISLESLSEHFGTQLNDAAKSFDVSRSKLKRICRGYGIKRWPGKKRVDGDISCKIRKINDEETSRRNFSSSEMLLQKDTPFVVHPQQYMDKMTVKATCGDVNIVFDLLNSSGMTDLEDNVIERLHLERKKFTIEYQDGDGDWILIACDKDVSKCMEISRSLKKETIKMSINQPLKHCAP